MMAFNTLKKSLPAQNEPDSRTIFRARVSSRTRELVLRAGRLPPDVTQDDYEEAKREITREFDHHIQCWMLGEK